MEEKSITTFALTDKCRELLKKLADSQGVSMTAWLEMFIRKEAKEEGIE